MTVTWNAAIRRRLSVLALPTTLILATAGCAHEAGPANTPAVSASAPSSATWQAAGADHPLAQLRDGHGFLLNITSATRDPGGFLTVSGTLLNTTHKSAVVSAFLRGDETEILRHGMSFGGATLTDVRGKKRYYVLRDTDGRPLTTTGLSILDAGQSAPVYMQFPSPPATTTQVTLQLPTFRSGTINVSK